MKHSLKLLFFGMLMLAACGKSGETKGHHHDGPADDDPNEALYNQVNQKHEEVMGRMDQLYSYKVKLTEKIAKNPGLPADEKAKLQGIISGLDSADHAMKVWMRAWMNSVSDSLQGEQMRDYLENQMEGIKKVEQQMIEAVDKAKGEAEK